LPETVTGIDIDKEMAKVRDVVSLKIKDQGRIKAEDFAKTIVQNVINATPTLHNISKDDRSKLIKTALLRVNNIKRSRTTKEDSFLSVALASKGPLMIGSSLEECLNYEPFKKAM
jgi:hypothetical protein